MAVRVLQILFAMLTKCCWTRARRAGGAEGGEAGGKYRASFFVNVIFGIDGQAVTTPATPPSPVLLPSFLGPVRDSRAVVLKTIRVFDGLDGATSDLVSGVNVLHLVRDPRAVVRSQLLNFGMKKFREVLPNFENLEGIKDGRKKQTETRRAVGR